MTSEKGTAPVRHQPWAVAAETLRNMLFCLVPLGLLALAAWPLGWLPDSPGPVFAAAIAGGSRPIADLYRARPAGRRSAVAMTLFAVVGLPVAGGAIASWMSPSAEDLGFALGTVVGLPLGAAVFVWRINHRGREGSSPRPVLEGSRPG
ncbi:hypothetical protein OG937_40175 [Streptomyces sp. NBC_00510]